MHDTVANVVLEVIGLCAFCVVAMIMFSAMMDVLVQRIIRREIAQEEAEQERLDRIRDGYGDV